MKFFCTLTTIFAISNTLYGMFPLNSIEKALVLREIKVRGLSAIEKEIEISQQSTVRSQSEPTLHTSQSSVPRSFSTSYIRVPTFLKIQAIFCKTETNSDILTTTIFDTIASIERKNGYNPTAIESIDGHYCYTKNPTNYLGHYTRYYWAEENDKNIVRIQADILNKKDLQKITNHERELLNEAINTNQLIN